jgi:hypothetical protein
MIHQFKQYKYQEYKPCSQMQDGFASMSKTEYPSLAIQIDKTTRLRQQLAIVEAKYLSMQQQTEIAKNLLVDPGVEKNEKELLWLTMMQSHMAIILSNYYEKKVLPLRAGLWGMQMEYERIMKNADPNYLNNQ